MMKSACCASSTRDQTGCVMAMSRAGMKAATYATINGCLCTLLNASEGISFAVDSQNAEEEARENCLHAQGQKNESRDDLAHRRSGIECAEPNRSPRQYGDDSACDADRTHQHAQRESALQLDVLEHRGVSAVGWMKARAHREDFREHGEHDELITHQAEEAGEEKGVDVESKRPDRLRACLEGSSDHQTHSEQGQPGIQEEPAGAEQQHEAQVAPAVAPRAQVWRPRSAVRPERHPPLADPPSFERGRDHQLRRALHPRGPQPQALKRFLLESPTAPVTISRRRVVG